MPFQVSFCSPRAAAATEYPAPAKPEESTRFAVISEIGRRCLTLEGGPAQDPEPSPAPSVGSSISATPPPLQDPVWEQWCHEHAGEFSRIPTEELQIIYLACKAHCQERGLPFSTEDIDVARAFFSVSEIKESFRLQVEDIFAVVVAITEKRAGLKFQNNTTPIYFSSKALGAPLPVFVFENGQSIIVYPHTSKRGFEILTKRVVEIQTITEMPYRVYFSNFRLLS